MTKPLIIALFGQIGSGKSTAGHFFNQLGIPVFDADHCARDLLTQDTVIQHQITQYFGPQVINSQGDIDRKALQQMIFADTAKRICLEQLLHPKIEQALLKQVQALKSPYAVVLFPLLVERQRFPWLDRWVAIVCNPLLQQQRVLQRDGMTEVMLKQILTAQPSLMQLQQAVDEIWVNDGSLDNLKQHVLQCHQRYLKYAVLTKD